jgi:hypothetical protein
MFTHIILIVLLLPCAWCAGQNYCQPAPQLQADLQKAATSPAKDRTDFDHNVAAFRSLRQQYSQDVFAHERYQDAVQEYGIEGHLRALVEEYQIFQVQNPEDWKYQYLFDRALIGRNTPSAITGLSEIAKDHPEFAPAHRSLAEIYSSEAFRNSDKEQTERERLQALCPGTIMTSRPYPLPEPSALMAEAERLVTNSGNPAEIMQLTNDAIRADEWRLQRIRPFDWYSAGYKKQQQNDLQIEYWRAWELQVRSYWKAGRFAEADKLVKKMEERAAFLHNEADLVRWDALEILVRLYEEGKQRVPASQKLDAMRQLLTQHPDLKRTVQVEELQRNLP